MVRENNPRSLGDRLDVSRRAMLGTVGVTGASAGCQGRDGAETPASETAATTDPTVTGDVTVDDQSQIRYVESAAEMNRALRDLPETGGTVRWRPGRYTGESFTEMVEIPTEWESGGTNVTLDMRSVHVKIRRGDPYRGEDGAFFYKPPSDGSNKVTILGPHRLHIGSSFENVDPTDGTIAADEADQDPGTFAEENPSPHVFYLYDTGNCRIAPSVSATNADRILYFRQNSDCGHHVFTNGFTSWGGNVALQIGDDRDPCGKDRCQWYGQVDGYADCATLMEHGLNNRIWVQFEGPRPSVPDDADVAGHRVRNMQNALMMIHILRTGKHHSLDIQARNTAIFNSATVGSPQPFFKSRLGIRPSNVHMANYTASVHDFGVDPRSFMRTVEDGTATVGYDDREGEVTLQAGPQSRAALQTTGPVGRMGHHVHGYTDARIVGQEAGNAPAVFRFGAWIDADNHAMVTYDPRNDVPLGARIRRQGESLGGTANVESLEGPDGTVAPAGWIAFVRADYQAFFHNYDLVYESYHDLTDWPADPKLRADVRNVGSTEATARLRRLEYGDGRKAEAGEMFIAQTGLDRHDTIDRDWRVDDPSVG